ncbi:unnamed protein product [Thlaspi arvense]|uniref:Uncharacterized protein n=1 Tax=Thlaspi arvense TaxID=13288 RepID=A0AAU9SFS5_THLAR|nr:unnamed protein product [Thlaspi arvense]
MDQDELIFGHHEQFAELGNNQRLLLGVNPLFFVEESPEAGRGADELNELRLGFDPIVVNLQQRRVHLNEALCFEIEAFGTPFSISAPQILGLFRIRSSALVLPSVSRRKQMRMPVNPGREERHARLERVLTTRPHLCAQENEACHETKKNCGRNDRLVMGGEKKDSTFPDDVKTSPLLLYLLRTSFPCPNLGTTTASQHNSRSH